MGTENTRRDNNAKVEAPRDMYAVNDEGKSAYELRKEAYERRHAKNQSADSATKDVLELARAAGEKFEKGMLTIAKANETRNEGGAKRHAKRKSRANRDAEMLLTNAAAAKKDLLGDKS